MGSKVALLRAVNVGARKVPMAALRSLCEDLGWRGVETYIQSGNVLFDANGERAELEAALEGALREAFGFEVPVMVRSAAEWPLYVDTPFPEAAATEPNRLMLMLSRAPPLAGAEEKLRERARDGERIEVAGDAVWIHYPGGAGRSRLSPTLIDRLIGSPATARNYRTVLKLRDMLA